MKKLLLSAVFAAVSLASVSANALPTIIAPGVGLDYVYTSDLGPTGSGKTSVYLPLPGVFAETFDQGAGACGLTTAAIVTGGPFAYGAGTVPNNHAQPYLDNTCYAYGPTAGTSSPVLNPLPPGAEPGTLSSVLIDYLPLLTAQRIISGNPSLFLNYFGLYYGSIDVYNKLEFFKDADGDSATTGDLVAVATVTGTDILSLCQPGCTSGAQTSDDTNRFVNLYFSSAVEFSAVRFSTWGVAVEVDNVTVGFGVTPGEQVPEPASLALAGVALAALGFASRRRKSGK